MISKKKTKLAIWMNTNPKELYETGPSSQQSRIYFDWIGMSGDFFNKKMLCIKFQLQKDWRTVITELASWHKEISAKQTGM